MASSGSVSEQFYGSRDTSPHGGERSHVVRPLQHNKWYKGTDGFLVTDIWGPEVGSMVSATPTVLLHQTEERMYLCVYQHKSLTLILLFPISSILNGEQGISVVKQQIVENVSLLFVLVTIMFTVFLHICFIRINVSYLELSYANHVDNYSLNWSKYLLACLVQSY